MTFTIELSMEDGCFVAGCSELPDGPFSSKSLARLLADVLDMVVLELTRRVHSQELGMGIHGLTIRVAIQTSPSLYQDLRMV
jgi:hypothetical protein